MRKAVVSALFAFAFLTGCKGKPKLEGKIVGFKPGSTTTLIVHAKATKGSKIYCASGGYPCDIYEMPASGEKDFEVDMMKASGDTPKKVVLTAELGKNKEEVVLDVATSIPPVLEVSSAGYLSCTPRDCSGSINVVTGQAELYVAAGTVVEIGSTSLTADKFGKAAGAVNITPSMKDVSLAKVCAKDKAILGSVPVAVTLPDKTKLTTKFDITSETVSSHLDKAMDVVKKGTAVTFPWEKPGAAKGKTSIHLTASTCRLASGDAKLGDIHVVVFSEDTQTRPGECSYTSDKGTHATAKITMHDEKATAYDRTTGKNLGTKFFEAPKKCDADVYGSAGNLSAQDVYVSETAIAAWGATLVR